MRDHHTEGICVQIHLSPVASHSNLKEVHCRTTNEAGHKHIIWSLVQLLGRANLLYDSCIHHGEATGYGHGFHLVVGYIDEGGSQSLVEFAQLGTSLHSQLGIQIGKGFIEQIKERVLNQEWLEELVGLVNKELDSTHDILRDRLDAIDAELNDVRIRLSKLYDALETGKLSLDDLAPRIKELRARQDELSKAILQLEAEKITRGIKHVDAEVIRSYAIDLKSLLEEADIAESKAFLRSFIKRIEIDKSQAVVYYNLPMPPDGKRRESLGVLPIDTPGGAEGTRTPDLLRAKEALSQLSYSPIYQEYYNNSWAWSQFT